ncbi:phage capsid protein [Yersinia sp. 2540 StPb PI]|uniref:phage capsid protein n=1 Tax=Yersinia sp. 2540 StPb PI TaxID=3117406 RepID=UPI003FA48A3C
MEGELIIDGQAVPMSENQETTTTETTVPDVTNTDAGEKKDPASEVLIAGDGKEDQTQEEYSLTVGEEEIPLHTDEEDIDGKPAPNWVKDLRKGFKEQQKENRELKRQLEQIQSKPAEQPSQQQSQMITKPTLESCDYDEELFDKQLTSWHESNTRAEQAKQQQVKQQQEWQNQFKQRVDAHQQRAKSLPVKDYAEMEEIVRAEMPDLHKEVLIHSADEGSELIAYALGKNPQLRQRIAAEKDPLRVAYQLGQLSAKVKLAPKAKQAAKPEPEIRGGAGNAKTDDFNKRCPGAVIE